MNSRICLTLNYERVHEYLGITFTTQIQNTQLARLSISLLFTWKKVH